MPGKPAGPTGTSTNLPWIDTGTMCRAPSFAPVTLSYSSQLASLDELTPIARYMATEMNVNSRSNKAKEMAQLNAFSATECITEFTNLPLWKQFLQLGVRPRDCVDRQISFKAAALLLWTVQVMQGADWDHKPKIAARFNSRAGGGLQHWHRYGGTSYFYDVWSNLHYGYVGAAAGFSDAVLLDGAGLEQIGSTVKRGERPSRAPGISGLRAFDDTHDRNAITAGIGLYRRNPDQVTARELVDLVRSIDVRTLPAGP